MNVRSSGMNVRSSGMNVRYSGVNVRSSREVNVRPSGGVVVGNVSAGISGCGEWSSFKKEYYGKQSPRTSCEFIA